MHGAQSPSFAMEGHYTPATPRRSPRKRKAETLDANNERLSKRLSLLNLGTPIASRPLSAKDANSLAKSFGAEHNGQKLYVPVETTPPTIAGFSSTVQSSGATAPANPSEDDLMQVDNSKYKVYIYSIDDELSSSESEPEDPRLVYIPDLQTYLDANRIPPSVLPNSDGELAGMQMVLYNVPTSLTVPEEHDSVRRAIIEARGRAREKQRGLSEGKGSANVLSPGGDVDATVNQAVSIGSSYPDVQYQDDPDAMDLS